MSDGPRIAPGTREQIGIVNFAIAQAFGLLIGQYEMLATTLNSLAVEPDEPPTGRAPRAMRLLRAIERRRRGAQARSER